MLGSIIGDMVGSRFEFNNHRSTQFELLTDQCSYTDDTVMTVAVADALLNHKPMGTTMQEYGRRYPNPMGGYGGRFAIWLHRSDAEPYNSFGNGSGMRMSPCALLAHGSREKALSQAAISAMPTHNHPEGVKGAMAIADAIMMAFDHVGKEEMRYSLSRLYGYSLDFTCESIRNTNCFNETCMVTVPQAIVAFLDAHSFEETLRLAVSIGGDSDTLAAMAGGIAEAYYGIPDDIIQKSLPLLPPAFIEILKRAYEQSEAESSKAVLRWLV